MTSREFHLLSPSSGQKATPADQNLGSQQQPHLAPCRDLMLLVTLPNCLWTADRHQRSWQNTPVILHMTPSVAITRMWHALTRRAALWPMTSMKLAEVRVGALAVRLDGWKTRSMDNNDVFMRSATTANKCDSNKEEHLLFYNPSLLHMLLVICVVREHLTHGVFVVLCGLVIYLSVSQVLHPEHFASFISYEIICMCWQ